MANNPFTLLKEVVDPIMATTSADASIFNDPFLAIFNFEDYQGMQPDSAGKIDIWKVTSMPAINIGDYWQYTSGSKKTTTGSLKCKKMTISVGLSEDELDRITKLGANNSIIAKELINLQKDTFDYLKQTLHLWITDPWGGVTTGEDYDASYVGALAASSTGTISNPSDLNATAGTANDLQALNFSGTAQTANNVNKLVSEIIVGMKKVDAVTKKSYSWKKYYMLVDPKTKAILDSSKEILNSTTGERSKETFTQLLAMVNIEVIELEQISYTFASGNTMTALIVADPQEWFTIFNIATPEGEGWSDWKEIPVSEAGVTRYKYEKHRKIEFGVLPISFYLRTSATASAFYKPLYRVTITPYENT